MNHIYQILLLVVLFFMVMASQAAEIIGASEFTVQDFKNQSVVLKIQEDQTSELNKVLHEELDPLFFKYKKTQLVQITGPAGYRFWLSPNSSSATALSKAFLDKLGTELNCTKWERDYIAPLELLNRPHTKLVAASEKIQSFFNLLSRDNATIKLSDLVTYSCENQFVDSYRKEYGHFYKVFILDPAPQMDPEPEFRALIVDDKWVE